ncbi:hypothetical protein VTN02DRAFT_5648 [Thermoascus thermophilus]
MGACMLVSGLTLMAGGRTNGIAAVTMFYLFQVCPPNRSANRGKLVGHQTQDSRLTQAFFTWGWMSNMWCYPSEILPLRIRQRGSALSVAWQWLVTFLVVEVTPVGIRHIGWRLYVVFGVLNWASVAVVWLWFPETSGRTLESIDVLFVSQRSLRQVVRLSRRRDGVSVAREVQVHGQVHEQAHEQKKVEEERVE